MISSNNEIDEKLTHPRLQAFARRFGKAHLDLACHAAFPLALTPELLYCLRENFQPQAPWIAVADILLSLCDSVGYELYELEPEVRHELITTLKQDFGKERLYKLSDFMVAYIRQKLSTNEQTNYRADEDLGAAPHWTALAYIKPEQASHDIAEALKKALAKQNPTDWVKLTSLIESYADTDPLIESGFQPLLVLARGWDAKARGETETAAAEFEKLGLPGEQIEIAGVNFKIPPATSFSFEVVTVNRRGEIIKRELKTAQYYTQKLPSDIPLEMVAIPGGTFIMGSPEDEAKRYDNESPQHQVTVQPFFMGTNPITQAQWRVVANMKNLRVNRDLKPEPSNFKGDNLPVEQVSWYDAVEFCARLSKHTEKEYRLPSEAEWEYACRAGTTTPQRGSSVAPGGNPHDRADSPFHFGETITGEFANYNASRTYADEPKGEESNQTTPVGQFPPNAFGLYDMHGNVWEWCLDDWHDSYENAPTDGSAWFDKDYHSLYQNKGKAVLRGGSWYLIPEDCRSASRYFYPSRDLIGYDYGFRVVCAVGRTS